jgi:DNA invertase Pin-like site-specific DNA recombinase
MTEEPTTVTRMPRPHWTITTDEERKALVQVDRAVGARREADEQIIEAVRAARALKVPMRLLSRKTGLSEATLYRRLGENKTDSAET